MEVEIKFAISQFALYDHAWLAALLSQGFGFENVKRVFQSLIQIFTGAVIKFFSPVGQIMINDALL